MPYYQAAVLLKSAEIHNEKILNTIDISAILISNMVANLKHTENQIK